VARRDPDDGTTQQGGPAVKSRYVRAVGLTLAILLGFALPQLSTGVHADPLGKVPHVGYIWIGAEGSDRATRPGLQQGLRELGYQDGRDIIIEYRYADGDIERLRELVADTIARKVDIIVVPGVIVADAVKRATTSIPVVALVGDPLASGLVESLARPGGNITGFSSMVPEYGGKLVELLHGVVPAAARVAVLWNPLNAASRELVQAVREGAARLGLRLRWAEVRQAMDFPPAFKAIADQSPDALIVDTDVVLISQRKAVIEFAAGHRLPAIYGLREFTEDGGLMSFGADTFELARLAAGYVDKILKGATPADLPIQQPTKFQLVVNLKTADQLDLTIPPSILARADEVIE
jgi:putative tryptophan/tyrosine transport system substrate-binding protein